ncbi:Crp/Fnr family transcriptional regulator [Rhodospirillaceae bacterium SYSU D60014]|uniref:Crp/Fnr family transcriptional regulator n=1 Tax=Virgifigura deserti TaxID=2268457 RepID=UPI000E6668F5
MPSSDFTHNQLLAALPSADLDRLRPHLERVDLPLKQVVHAPGAPIEHVYFPDAGMVSLITAADENHAVEVGTVGREGLVGTPVALGTDRAPVKALVQIPGTAQRLPAGLLRDEMNGNAALRDLVLRYVQALFVQVSQTAVCNRLHTVEERLARWLLMAHDRAETDRLPLTQEFLAIMLGVRRAGVTVAAGTLQNAGLIRYNYGRITVLDRASLEASSCACYGLAKDECDRLLG